MTPWVANREVGSEGVSQRSLRDLRMLIALLVERHNIDTFSADQNGASGDQKRQGPSDIDLPFCKGIDSSHHRRVPPNFDEKLCPRAALSAFLCFSFLSLLSERRFPQPAQRLTGRETQVLPIDMQIFCPKMRILHTHVQILPIVMQFLLTMFAVRAVPSKPYWTHFAQNSPDLCSDNSDP
jgi:hypothetical protein